MASPTTSKLTTAIDPQAVSHLCQLPPELLLHILDLIFQEHFPFAAATGLDDIVELTDEESDSEDGDFEDDGNSYGSDHSHQSVDSEELEIDDYSDPNYHSILTPDARPSSEDLEILALLDPEEVSRSTYMIPAILRSCRLLRLRGKETFLQYLTEDALHVQRTKSWPSINPQPNSRLSSLPDELLLKIFDHLIDHAQLLRPSIIAYEDTEEQNAAYDAATPRSFTCTSLCAIAWQDGEIKDLQPNMSRASQAPTVVQPKPRPSLTDSTRTEYLSYLPPVIEGDYDRSQVNLQPNSKICSLPNELILNIYEHTFDDHFVITAKGTEFKTSKEHDKYVTAFTTEFRTLPRLLQTCSFLRRLGRKDFHTRVLNNARTSER
ncbi:hypothetical protein B0A48_11957 [Cryoendolithus antarcticus]|uniref:F-box domain-containing protein n=1 Tax=Cryoendolithus antarcticus TaxID=1507870 RepID=A0A1V8STP6_9PEZI|nr:hypothetical protein B0A48_11957 [Cryoendolithus antarcticus]